MITENTIAAFCCGVLFTVGTLTVFLELAQ